MSENISISFEFLDKYVRFTKPEHLQVYLYIKYMAEQDGAVPDAAAIAKALDISEAKAEFALEYWASCGEITEDGDGYSLDQGGAENKPTYIRPSLVKRIKSTKPAYSQEEVNAVAAKNKHISALFYQAESILNKVLTASDMEMLFSFNDWLGLPVEVIIMLLSYAAKKGKTTKRYLETVAIDWAEKGIDNYEAAEEYVSKLEAADNAERKIRSILGIYDRGLTTTERKYIKLWANEQQIPAELISIAYDRTVERTGKLSWSYMDKMLQSWVLAGCENAADVETADEEFYKNNTAAKPVEKKKKSKFNNYDDDNKTDYDELERQILDMMLDED